MRNACIFAGPSLAGRTLPPGIETFPPATRGALIAALGSGYRRIGFVDGAIEDDEMLPVKELREALAMPDVTVIGGASMGAVRAVQLESEGMEGVGRVFRLFRRGSLTASDEVYVLHAPAALRYRCLTLPLVNIRYTLRALRLARYLSGAKEQALVAYVRDVPWFDRDRHSLSGAVYAMCGSVRCTRIMQAFDIMYRDIKYEDAMSVVSRVHSYDASAERNQSIERMRVRSRIGRRA